MSLIKNLSPVDLLDVTLVLLIHPPMRRSKLGFESRIYSQRHIGFWVLPGYLVVGISSACKEIELGAWDMNRPSNI